MAGRISLTHGHKLLPLLLLLTLVDLAQAQFEYTIEDGTVTITQYTGPGGDVVIPDTINSLPVTGIGYGAFRGDGLTIVRIGSGVASIGNSAFSGCINLTEIIVDPSNSSYGSLEGVLFDSSHATLIQCPGGKTGSYAIPDSVINIGDNAFRGCTSLTSIDVGKNVTRISTGAFAGCTSLTSVIIPDGVNYIGDGAFSGCTGLADCTMPDSVTSIGSSAFSGCISLTNIVIPDRVTSIADSAFSNCTSLTNLTIGMGVTSFTGPYGFELEGLGIWGCPSLMSITVDPMNSAYGSLDGVLFNRSRTRLLQYPVAKPGNYTIPNTVTTVVGYAFNDCRNLISVTIPNSVNSLGTFAFAGCTGLTSVTIPASITSIGSWQFRDCTSLTNIIIPETVTDIGLEGFWGCVSLTAFTVDARNPAYRSLDGVLFDVDQKTLLQYPLGKAGSYAIPDGVTRIEERAFAYCTALTSVEIPDSVTSVGTSAFYDCLHLTTVKIGKNVTTLGESAFRNCSSLVAVYFEGDAPELVEGGSWPPYEAFDGTSATIYYLPGTSGWGADFGGRPTAVYTLEEVPFEYTFENGAVTITKYTGPGGDVVIPETIEGMAVTGIGSSAFSGRADLTGVVIPESVTSIGESAFDYCTGLSNITIPNSVTNIGFMAWYGCSGLSSVAVPSSVTSLSGWAFGGCPNLTAISVEVLNPNYSSHDGVLFDKSQSILMRCPGGKIGSYAIPASVTRIEHFAFELCAGLTSVDIPNSVDRIPEFAFADCSGLTDVTLPDSVTSIDEYAFGQCTSLTSITIPDSVTTIGWVAFMGCTGLTNVTIGNGVIKIGYAAFHLCSGLTSLTIPEGVKSIESGAFNGCTSLTAAYFKGDAPVLGGDVFADPITIVYYLPGTSGWGAIYGGRPTMPWGVVWGSLVKGDVTGDEVVDRNDLSLVVASRNQPAVNAEDPRDLDGDGMITVLDARILVTLFSVPGGLLNAASSPEGVVLDWAQTAGAVKLQSTTDLSSGQWQDVGGLRSSTNAVIGTSAERMFFRLVLPE